MKNLTEIKKLTKSQLDLLNQIEQCERVLEVKAYNGVHNRARLLALHSIKEYIDHAQRIEVLWSEILETREFFVGGAGLN